MRYLFIFLLFAAKLSAQQQFVVKKDGSKIPLYSFEINERKKRIDYKVNSQHASVPFAEIDSVVTDNKVLRRIDMGKKVGLYHVIVSDGARMLAVKSSKRKRERGGFESIVTLYEVVLLTQGKITQILKFTESKTESEVSKRQQFYELATSSFPDCEQFLRRMLLLENSENESRSILLNYLDNPERLQCH